MLKSTRIRLLFADTIYANSLFLIFSTAAMAGFGFLFWIINAKLFSIDDIGVASTLIPIANIIAIASLCGIDTSIVRFLGKQKNITTYINSSFMFISCVAITAATVFSLTVSIHSPNLSLFFNNSFGYIVFIVLTVSTALNLFFDAIYLAHRKTFYTFIVTVIFSILKTIFPFLFISFGPVGIIAAGAFSQFCGIIIHLFITHRQWEYFGNLKFSLFDLHQGWSYTATNYIANLLNLLPACIVPLIVFNKVGAAQAAYYYIVTMIVNLLYVVSNATTKSLFTEGSHSLEQLSLTIKKAVVLISVITIPGILILSLLSNFILNFFGAQYSAFGTYTLLIFGISAIPIGAYALNTALFRIHKQTSELIFCNIMYAALLISTTYVFSKNGLPGIANAWLLSNTIIAGITTIIVFFKKGYR